MSTSTDRTKAFEALLQSLVEVLKQKRLRTGQLLAAANVQDRRAGEDAVWALVQRGRVVIGPDSTLRLTNDDAPKKKRSSTRVTEEAR